MPIQATTSSRHVEPCQHVGRYALMLGVSTMVLGLASVGFA